MIKIKIKLFASLRGTLGADDFTLELAQSISINEIVEQLSSTHGAQWADALAADNILYAVNQTIMVRETIIVDGDELAFLPPVTGG